MAREHKYKMGYDDMEILVIRNCRERGYWSNSLGWVYDVKSATQFTEREFIINGYRMPGMLGDSELIPLSQALDFNLEG